MLFVQWTASGRSGQSGVSVPSAAGQGHARGHARAACLRPLSLVTRAEGNSTKRRTVSAGTADLPVSGVSLDCRQIVSIIHCLIESCHYLVILHSQKYA